MALEYSNTLAGITEIPTTEDHILRFLLGIESGPGTLLLDLYECIGKPLLNSSKALSFTLDDLDNSTGSCGLITIGGIKDFIEVNKSSLQERYIGSTGTPIQGIQGIAGDDGTNDELTGLQGIQGAQGLQGRSGVTRRGNGIQGYQGYVGPTGTIMMSDPDKEQIIKNNLQSCQGSQGDPGAVNWYGPQGAKATLTNSRAAAPPTGTDPDIPSIYDPNGPNRLESYYTSTLTDLSYDIDYGLLYSDNITIRILDSSTAKSYQFNETYVQYIRSFWANRDSSFSESGNLLNVPIKGAFTQGLQGVTGLQYLSSDGKTIQNLPLFIAVSRNDMTVTLDKNITYYGFQSNTIPNIPAIIRIQDDEIIEVVIKSGSGNTLTLRSIKSQYSCSDVKGPQGVKGIQGPTGDTIIKSYGETGPQGTKGPQGLQGVTGKSGINGTSLSQDQLYKFLNYWGITSINGKITLPEGTIVKINQ